MIKKSMIVMAAFLIFSFRASAAQVAESCGEQNLKIQSLENDRAGMAGEIERLREEIRRLNDVLDNIRSQAGDGGYRPT